MTKISNSETFSPIQIKFGTLISGPKANTSSNSDEPSQSHNLFYLLNKIKLESHVQGKPIGGTKFVDRFTIIGVAFSGLKELSAR